MTFLGQLMADNSSIFKCRYMCKNYNKALVKQRYSTNATNKIKLNADNKKVSRKHVQNISRYHSDLPLRD